MSTIYCPHHGWHPALQDTIDRLRALAAGHEDDVLREYLLREAGATTSGAHLMGSRDRAAEALRALEVSALEAVLALPSPDRS